MSSWEFPEQGLLVLPLPKELSSSCISELSCLCIFLTHLYINFLSTLEILSNPEHLIKGGTSCMEWQQGDGIKPACLAWDGAAALGSRFPWWRGAFPKLQAGEGVCPGSGGDPGAGVGHRQLLRDCWAPIPARCDHRS